LGVRNGNSWGGACAHIEEGSNDNCAAAPTPAMNRRRDTRAWRDEALRSRAT
jgi:hypothetical protein